MPKYIHLHPNWPVFTWDHEAMVHPLAAVRHKQGRLLGKLEGLGFQLRSEASFGNLILDVMKSSEIAGERLPMDQVRSSIARKLGLEVAGLVHVARNVDGVDAGPTQKYEQPLTKDRLFTWHGALTKPNRQRYAGERRGRRKKYELCD